MWCATCQAEVAAEVSADAKSLRCTTCGDEIRKVYAPSLHDETRSARELLDRWSAEDLLDPTSEPALPADDMDEPRVKIAQETEEPVPAPPVQPPEADARHPHTPSRRRKIPGNRQFRVDAAHSGPKGNSANRRVPREGAARNGRFIPAPHQDHRGGGTKIPRGMRLDDPHAAIPAPHIAFRPKESTRRGNKPGRTESLFGQLLAYGGVCLLTVGTALVLWGYFGGPPEYTPTGWLVTTIGQMLLFLGVVTLISGGMQQTTHEVGQRVEFLDNRMRGIEQATNDVLRGPHFSQAEQRANQHARSTADGAGGEGSDDEHLSDA